jgi:hypothetical protein
MHRKSTASCRRKPLIAITYKHANKNPSTPNRTEPQYSKNRETLNHFKTLKLPQKINIRPTLSHSTSLQQRQIQRTRDPQLNSPKKKTQKKKPQPTTESKRIQNLGLSQLLSKRTLYLPPTELQMQQTEHHIFITCTSEH